MLILIYKWLLLFRDELTIGTNLILKSVQMLVPTLITLKVRWVFDLKQFMNNINLLSYSVFARIDYN